MVFLDRHGVSTRVLVGAPLSAVAATLFATRRSSYPSPRPFFSRVALSYLLLFGVFTHTAFGFDRQEPWLLVVLLAVCVVFDFAVLRMRGALTVAACAAALAGVLAFTAAPLLWQMLRRQPVLMNAATHYAPCGRAGLCTSGDVETVVANTAGTVMQRLSDTLANAPAVTDTVVTVSTDIASAAAQALGGLNSGALAAAAAETVAHPLTAAITTDTLTAAVTTDTLTAAVRDIGAACGDTGHGADCDRHTDGGCSGC